MIIYLHPTEDASTMTSQETVKAISEKLALVLKSKHDKTHK